MNRGGGPDLNTLGFRGLSSNNAIRLAKTGNPSAITLQYNRNNTGWTDYTISTIITLSANLFVQFSGNNNHFNKTSAAYYQFQMTGSIEAFGNIQSLMNYSDSCTSACYANLFSGCSQLINIDNLLLPATTLTNSCYYSMFAGCTKLSSAPSLPATKLANACYREMFSGCTHLNPPSTLLTSATSLADCCYSRMFAKTLVSTVFELPNAPLTTGCYAGLYNECKLKSVPSDYLPATTLAPCCYFGMFENCYALNTPPSLPASTLTNKCYGYMFFFCYALSTAPTLPAKTLAPSCYMSMFASCYKLKKATKLPATTLKNGCYNGMFSNCSSLLSAPALPATKLSANCYANMFFKCTSLTSINVNFTTWSPSTATDHWVNGIPSTGTRKFTKPSGLTTTYGDNYIPSGWTVVNK